MFDIRKYPPFRLLFTAVLIVTFLTHISYIPNGFTWLDHGDIERKRAVASLEKLPAIFTNRFGDTGFYRPLITLSNSLDAILYENSALGFHATNVLLHIAVTAAVPLFLFAFFRLKNLELLLATLFFGIHPVSFLPVGAISYRQELLLSLFIFLSVYFHAKTRQTGKKLYALLTLLSILLAMFSKETALMILPCFIILWEIKKCTGEVFHIKKRLPILHQLARTYKENARLFLAETFVTGVYLVLRFFAIPEIWRVGQSVTNLYESVLLRLFLFGKLLTHLFNPTTPPLSDSAPLDSFLHPFVFFTILALGLSFLIVKKLGAYHTISFALILLFLSLAPGLNIVPTPRIASPHYAYLAIPSFAALLVLLFRYIAKRKSSQLVFFTFCVTLWFAIAIRSTFISGFQFKNDVTLFTPETNRDQRFLEGYFYLGNYYLMNRQYALAETMFKKSLTLQDGYLAYNEPVSTMTNLAAVYYAQKQYDKADDVLKEIQTIAPADKQFSVLYNRALLANEQNQYQKVVTLLEDNHGENPLAMLLLADALHKLKRNNDAKEILEQSLPYWSNEQKQRIETLLKTIPIEDKK